MKHLLTWLVRFYRKFLSPLKPPCCRFTPTCSAYMLEAIETRGALVGLLLTVWRILRCNPFCRGGYDPVPKTGFRNPTLFRGEPTCPNRTNSGVPAPYPVVRVKSHRNSNTRENPTAYEKNLQTDSDRAAPRLSSDDADLLR